MSVIDTLNPIVEGAPIPGAFGTGKTVLQHVISRQAEADVVIAACGERANRWLEYLPIFLNIDLIQVQTYRAHHCG